YFNETWRRWFPTAKSDITAVCATYLSFDIFENGSCRTNEKFRKRLRANPLYSYAAQNWGHHARECSELSSEVMSFLQSTAKVEASSQAMSGLYSGLPNYSQEIPKNMTGLHLAAYFGLGKEIGNLLSDSRFSDIADMADSFG